MPLGVINYLLTTKCLRLNYAIQVINRRNNKQIQEQLEGDKNVKPAKKTFLMFTLVIQILFKQ